IQPFVQWKNQKGIPTSVIDVAEVGTTASVIQTFIANYFDAHPELSFVHLVGDQTKIPTLTQTTDGVSNAGMDPRYGMILPNSNTNYQDIFISRFSGSTVAHIQTQVDRSIHYERDLAEGEWLNNATGIGGAESGGHFGESDKVHMENIRQLLLNTGTFSSVDAFYQGNSPAFNTASLTTAFNEGRALINYIAHGDYDGWYFSGGYGSPSGNIYHNSNVNSLTNVGMLPVIFSVACQNGNFTNYAACYGETWLRATDGTTGEPTGAIAVYGGSINQPWHQPMYAQDHANQLLTSRAVSTIGGLYFSASMYMMDTSPHPACARSWNIFGDASLQFRTTEPIEMAVTPPDILFMGLSEFTIEVDTPGALICLYNPETEEIITTLYADESGFNVITLDSPFMEPGSVILTVTAFDRITYVQELQIVPNDNPYIVYGSVSYAEGQSPDNGETITLNIVLNNIGGAPAEEVTATLLCTDTYITILENITTIELIDASDSYEITDVFLIKIAQNVPDQHQALFTIRTESDDRFWANNFSITLQAPTLSTDEHEIVEIIGNMNSRFDPGETVELKVPIINTGHATSSEGYMIMYANTDMVTFEENRVEIAAIPALETGYATFVVTANEEMLPSTAVTFGYFSEFSTKELQDNFMIKVGLVVEDFGDGDFSDFGWVHGGHAEWIITDEEVYEGNYSMRSGAIGNYQTTSIELPLSLTIPGTISFYYKVSSIPNVDKLQFRVDNVIRGDWHGLVDWTYFEYEIPAGDHILKWQYSKGQNGSLGEDCGWIDYIVFPALGTDVPDVPMFYINKDVIEFEGVTTAENPTDTFRIVNLGSIAMQGVITVPERFGIYPGSGLQTVPYTINP
ncbi:MAG: C25 family cysteine peptidase, partial [Candidatus Cloacimonetes bacterium]|nr:C25 family cysteine peptidase [Candidatus Cloacimonadota bacterium]